MRKSRVLMAVATTLWLPAIILAQRPAPTATITPALTALDYEEIRRAENYWIHGGDMDDRNMLMRAFVPGGIFRRPARVGSCRNSETDCDSVQRPLTTVLPKEPVVPAIPYAKVSAGCRVSQVAGCIRQHYLTDVLIEPTPQGAKVLAHLFVVEKDPGKPPMLTTDSGAYIDDLVKGPDGWGIKIKRWLPFRDEPPSMPIPGNPYKD